MNLANNTINAQLVPSQLLSLSRKEFIESYRMATKAERRFEIKNRNKIRRQIYEQKKSLYNFIDIIFN